MTRLLAALVAALALGAGLAVPGPAAGAPDPAGRAKGSDDGYRATKTLTRVFTDADGSTFEFPPNTVTVTADHTRDLRGRQRIGISWSGAQPSGGRASNPYGENGLQQEYPVVVLQCRGRDDPSLPAAKRLSPSTCWTTSVAQRSQLTRGDADAAWTHDLLASDADKQRVSGVDPFPDATTCPGADTAPYSTRLTPFVSRKGTVYPACASDQMPPEAAVGAAFPPHEVAAFTDAQGRGSVQFEVRSDVENESLGCSDQVACSVVVIPINGLSCDRPSVPMTVADDACRRGGRFLPGSSNFANEGVDQAVSPALWWSASNWANRFSIPITFGLPPDACDVLDPRPPTGFYGSELLAQAALQWTPAYCLKKSRFKFQLNQMSDEAGWNLMEAGGGAAAIVSSEHDRRGSDPVGYAPTAVTGFSVGYVIDRPGNAGEYTDLRLNARLLAKLLTQSYLGSDLGRGHPGMADNPLAIMADPEFVALNPGLSRTPQEAGATLLSLSNSSDLIFQLTDYLAHDPDSAAFLAGKPDPWGMRINPAYRKITVPRAEWPLLDDYVPTTQSTCRQENPAVYFTQLAAPVTTMRKIAEALIDAWPNVQTRCDFDQSTKLYKLGRIDRQSYGSRFMLGLVSLGDAERYGLRSAALRTRGRTYVGPDAASLTAAVRLGEQDHARQPFTIDQGDVRRSGRAYPGTMVVYTAARLRNLEQETADQVAQFIRVSTSEGQRPGTGNGALPAGFVPLRRFGPTARLWATAQDVADAVEAQRPAPAPTPPATPGADPTGGSDLPDVSLPDPAPAAPDAPVAPPPSAAPTPVAPAPAASPTPTTVVMPATAPVSSRVAAGLLPALVGAGLLGSLAVALVRLHIRQSRRGP